LINQRATSIREALRSDQSISQENKALAEDMIAYFQRRGVRNHLCCTVGFGVFFVLLSLIMAATNTPVAVLGTALAIGICFSFCGAMIVRHDCQLKNMLLRREAWALARAGSPLEVL
jgi:hypothetical protein